MRTFVHVQKKKFRPAFSADHRRLPAFTQLSSGAIPATMDDYQRFLKRHRMLTRTLWCDGPMRCRNNTASQYWHIFPFTVYFFKTAHTQPKTLFDVCRMTPPSQRITHPSKPNICIKTYNLCSIENVCFLIYLTMDNKIQTTAININL